ncbi:class I SAM-dependent methyltransferase [Fluviispira vulneris]|uniref:class I SAM-dependent methyltransferase n=1 Tax=Fluviispira vulneris TaxID=2763012 RepID=UPI0016452B3F|nr:class I SAM-dependent methyltransferase [Fluviispira vulneris]
MNKNNFFSNIKSYWSEVKIVENNISKCMEKESKKYAKGNLIDIGCGKKPYEEIFLKYVKSYYGIDNELTMKSNYGNETKADLYCDCENTGLMSESFDTLLSTQVLEHVFNTESFINECHRLLKKNGIAIFTVPQLWQLHSEPYDYYRFTKYSLISHFKNAGFEIIELYPIEGAFAALIQTKMVSIYSHINYTNKFTYPLKRFLRKVRKIFVYPILNICALKFDKYFYNEKLCLNYCLVVRKL